MKTVSTKHLNNIPEIDDLKKLLKSLATLDLIDTKIIVGITETLKALKEKILMVRNFYLNALIRIRKPTKGSLKTTMK